MKLSKTQALLDDKGKLINGTWELDRKHQLSFRSKGSDETATFKAKIIDTRPAGLSILLTHGQKNQQLSSKIYVLDGFWNLDAKNRITFEVRRHQGATDTLTFKNAWSVNDNHEVTYTYEEETLKTRKKITRTLNFNGYWDVAGKNRLVYTFAKSSDSQFLVRGAFQTPSILAKRGEMRYQFGVELNKRITTRTVTLFGKWKYSDRLGLHLEVEYRRGEKHAIVFGGDYAFADANKIEVNLRSREGEKLGIELVLSRDFLKKDGRAFVRFLRSEEESRVEGGLSFKW